VKDLHDLVATWRCQPGGDFALATLVRAHGSSYRRAGARMLIGSEGEMTRSLSGGCLEEEVAQHASDVLRTGAPKLLSFDTRLRFGCHGSIDIFVEPLERTFISEVAAHLDARQQCTAVTLFESTGHQPLGSRLLPFGVAAADGAFVQEIRPPLQLILFGDGPDSSAFRRYANTLGWKTLEVEHVSELPVSAIDSWTAAVIKSHNYGRDFAALRTLLPTSLRYIGLVGSRRRRDQLLCDVLDGGVSVTAELFAPAGLHLARETPEEIAFSIIAEIQQVFAGGTGESLRTSKAAIHGRARPSIALR
jgi:xanthine dehydrogenase accessory factor